MAGPKYSCPKCGFKLRPSHLRREGKPYFECPSCREKLRIPAAYRRLMLTIDILTTCAVPFVLGIRDPLVYVIVAMLAFFPVSFVSTLLIRSLHPPRFEPYEPADMSLRQISKNHP